MSVNQNLRFNSAMDQVKSCSEQLVTANLKLLTDDEVLQLTEAIQDNGNLSPYCLMDSQNHEKLLRALAYDGALGEYFRRLEKRDLEQG